MRITNTMIRNNMMLNLNNNMNKLSILENQMGTGKKIQVPSDDPIIAGKSLNLRTNIYETDQYIKNINDAKSWMDITEKSVDNITDVMDRIRELCVQGATGTLSSSDKEKIGSEIKQLREQLVQEANVNNAGRYVFSGHKTNKKLMFDRKVLKSYTISDKFNKDEINKVINNDSYYYKLSYNNIKDINEITIGSDTFKVGDTDNEIVFKSTQDSDAYNPPNTASKNTIHYIKETGEIVFNKDHYDGMSGDVKIEYQKDEFKLGDLNPEQYFDIVEKVNINSKTFNVNGDNKLELENFNIKEGSIKGLKVNGTDIEESKIRYTNSSETLSPTLGLDEIRVDMDTGKLTFGTSFSSSDNIKIESYERVNKIEEENIEYEVSRNTKLDINIMGKNIITEDMIRDIDELIYNIDNLSCDDVGQELSKMLGKIDEHKKMILKEHAGLGSRMNRIELIETRLKNDKINYTELMSKNEDADMAKVMTELMSQHAVYQASLMASSKIIQQSLVDYIR